MNENDQADRLDAAEAKVKVLESRMNALERLFRLQQEGMNLLKTGLDAHQVLLEAVGDLEVRRHGKHSGN